MAELLDFYLGFGSTKDDIRSRYIHTTEHKYHLKKEKAFDYLLCDLEAEKLIEGLIPLLSFLLLLNLVEQPTPVLQRTTICHPKN